MPNPVKKTIARALLACILAFVAFWLIVAMITIPGFAITLFGGVAIVALVIWTLENV